MNTVADPDDGAKPRLYRVIGRQILQLMEERAIGPGMRLPPERELAGALRVSRSALREALIALEYCGAVHIAPGSGVYARDTADLAAQAGFAYPPGDLFAARRLVGGEVAALAARHANEAAFAAIVQAACDIEHACPPDAAGERAFMLSIAAATGNTALEGVVGYLWSADGIPGPVPAAPTPTVAGHRAIVDAIAAHEVTAARKAMHAYQDARRRRMDGKRVHAPEPPSHQIGQ
jgi:DNA-binding FadR family transcriptional regulator